MARRLDELMRHVYIRTQAAIRDGVQSMWWERETFAYAESWDVTQHRYLGLKAGEQANVMLNANSVLVKPEVAACGRIERGCQLHQFRHRRISQVTDK